MLLFVKILFHCFLNAEPKPGVAAVVTGGPPSVRSKIITPSPTATARSAACISTPTAARPTTARSAACISTPTAARPAATKPPAKFSSSTQTPVFKPDVRDSGTQTPVSKPNVRHCSTQTPVSKPEVRDSRTQTPVSTLKRLDKGMFFFNSIF